MLQSYLPLSQRSVAQLRAQAAIFRCMATSARAAVVRNSLLRLAVRIDALADQREVNGVGSQPG